MSTSVVHYKGDEYICTGEPTLKSVDGTGTYAFYGFKKLHLCDPEKNTECKKSGCQSLCKYTLNEAYAKEKKNEKA